MEASGCYYSGSAWTSTCGMLPENPGSTDLWGGAGAFSRHWILRSEQGGFQHWALSGPSEFAVVTLRNNKVWVEDLGAETRVPVALGCALASLKANKSYCVVMACFLLGEKCSKQFWHMDEVCLYSSWNDTIDPNSFGRFFRLFRTMQFSLILHKICLQTITVGDVPIWLLQ